MTTVTTPASTRRTQGRRSFADQRGDTLLEVLIAVAILGIAGVAIMAGFSSSIVMSGVHRRFADTATDGRNYGELFVRGIDDKTIAYVACASASSYPRPAGFSANPVDTVSVTSVDYWNGTSFVGTCPPQDTGVQRVTIKVANTDARALSQVHVVIRKPCTLADVTAGPC